MWESAATDKAVRGLSNHGGVRIMTCTTTHLVNRLQSIHDTWPVATAALGRVASVGAMMAMMLKNQERLTLQIHGDGPLGKIVVDADSQGRVRGYVEHPHVHLPANALGKLDVGGAVGRGMLYVVRDLGLRDVYRGSAELQTGEIGDDFTYYFAVSEQTPSAVGAGVLVETDHHVIVSGGFVVQMLPGHTQDDVQDLENRLRAFPGVTDFLRQGAAAVDLLRYLVPSAQVLEERRIEHFCTCSRQRIEQVLKSLGKAELEAMLREQGGAEVVCHFCNTRYTFAAAELADLAAAAGRDPAAGGQA